MIYCLNYIDKAHVQDQWDYGIIDDLIIQDQEVYIVKRLPKLEKAIVIIAARHHAGLEKEINEQLNNIQHVVLFLLGDEEAVFDVEKIYHQSIYIWIQNPRPGKHDKYYKLGTGYPPNAKLLKNMKPNKETDVFFSGQLTHKRRLDLNDNLIQYNLNHKVDFLGTRGFTRGYEPEEYYKRLVKAKISPAPSGAEIPDSFRAFEALEAMCVLIADDVNSQKTITNYWNWLFNEEVPFYKIHNTDEWYGVFDEALKNYPHNLHKQTAWWLKWKRDFKNTVFKQLNEQKNENNE